MIAPPALHDAVAAALRDEGAVADSVEAIDAPIAVLTPLDSKGLEFDHVVVVEPAALVEPDRAGLRLLYVVLTRATAHPCGASHAAPLPEALGPRHPREGRHRMTITEADRAATDVAWDLEPLVDGARRGGGRRTARRRRGACPRAREAPGSRSPSSTPRASRP